MGNQSSSDTEAVKIANALKPFVKSWVDEWSSPCVRSKKMTVVTAPNASTGLIGVKDAFSDVTCNIPYSKECGSARVGDVLICSWMYDNMQTLFAERFCNSNRTSTLKGVLFGDSIAYGTTRVNAGDPYTQTNYPIHETIDALLGTYTQNFGIAGQGWAYSSSTAGGVLAYETISSHQADIANADYVLLEWGANDVYATLGNLLYSGDSAEPVTVLGQVFKCVNYVYTVNPKARVILIAPVNCKGNGGVQIAPNWQYDYYHTSSSPNFKQTRKAVSDALAQFCKNYWIPYIDMYEAPINAFNISAFLGADNVHPNDDGYIALGRYLAAKISSILM